MGLLAIGLVIPVEITAHLPGLGKLWYGIVPGEVAELNGVSTSVYGHQGMDQAGPIVSPQRPQATDAGLSFIDGNVKGPGRGIVDE